MSRAEIIPTCAVEGAMGESGKKAEGAHGRTFALKPAKFDWDYCRQRAMIAAAIGEALTTLTGRTPR